MFYFSINLLYTAWILNNLELKFYFKRSFKTSFRERDYEREYWYTYPVERTLDWHPAKYRILRRSSALQLDSFLDFQSHWPEKQKKRHIKLISKLRQKSMLIYRLTNTSSCICLERSSSCCLAFWRLLRSTWSYGVCANNSCKVIMYLGI